ncbi:MAG: hypothetical protein QM770_07305 [Tepidisphaeraceae bacterium]
MSHGFRFIGKRAAGQDDAPWFQKVTNEGFPCISGNAIRMRESAMTWLLLLGIVFVILAVATVPLALRLPIGATALTTAAALALIGAGVGVVCSFTVHWQPSPTLRFIGFPFPGLILQLEEGQWVDYVGGPITMVLNAVWFAAGFVVPVFVWVVLQRSWRPRTEH